MGEYRRHGWVALLAVVLAILATPAAAAEVTFEREYRYQASEADSKLTCRAIALVEVKRLLLEEIGTYLEAETEVRNYQLTKDQITTMTAGVVRTELVDERWNGVTYWLKARITVDPDEVATKIAALKEDRTKLKEMEDLENRRAESLQMIEDLKADLAAAQEQLVRMTNDYQEALRVARAANSFETAVELHRQGRLQEAIAAYTESIEADPTCQAYIQRGKAYKKLKKYRSALEDFNAAIEMKPTFGKAYYLKGRALLDSHRRQQAVAAIRKAAALGNGEAKLFLKLKGSKLQRDHRRP